MKHNLKTIWTFYLLLILCPWAVGAKDGPPPKFNPHKIHYSTKIKPEPISLYGNPIQYTVFKKTYHIRHNVKEFNQTGTASWYGKLFHGRRTSSGEPFNMYAISGAHKELPIPCYILVTNLDNKRQLIVRINDRGPFHTNNRVLDLSYAAAYKLGYTKKGVAKIQIKLLSPPIERNKIVIELGIFKQENVADALANKLRKELGYLPKYSVINIGKQTFVKLFLGPYPKKMDLTAIKKTLTKTHPDYKIKHI
ncbi:MAG TPA: septal ring lytic transglycosylase RlpA family protein [Gammaproteobacteria bacterium]|nr:septal ring lytic transglycosylase RlpA family protein [Gammaproteobacteria bacterium]